MRKSLIKRFKITKSGKILRRICGVCHNLAKKSRNKKRLKKKLLPLSKSEIKVIKKLINN